MRRTLTWSPRFVRDVKHVQRQNAELRAAIERTLLFLSTNAFHPRLKTHKLKGELSDVWSCSVGYDLRILFQFVEVGGRESILLINVGTHDDVY